MIICPNDSAVVESVQLTRAGNRRRLRGEFQEVGHFLAYAYEADGEIHLFGDGYGDAAFGGAIELVRRCR